MVAKPEDVFDPYDVELEQAILGSLLVDNRRIDEAAALLEPEDFYDGLHQRLFEMICYLQTEGAVTPPIVLAVMKNDPGLIQMDGIQYLIALVATAPSSPPIREFCSIIKDLAGRRKILSVADELYDAARRPPREAPTGMVVDQAANTLAAILAGTKEGQRNQAVSAADATDEMLRRIEQQAVSDKPHGVRTGLDAIDGVVGGLFPGKLVVLAGRPGMGKSILATNVGRQAAERGVPTDYLSAEMDTDELSARTGTDIDFDRCASDRLDPLAYGDFTQLRASAAAIGRMAEAQIRMRPMPLEFVYAPGMTLEWIEGVCRRRSRTTPGFRVVIIDHLQLVTVQGLRRGANRNDEQTIITRRLKALAGELGIAVVCLSQLSREVEKRDDKHPHLADLREGGSIEQDADVVIALLRPLIYARAKLQAARNEEQRHKAILEYDEAIGVLETAVLKNRGGRTTDYFKLFIDEKASAIRDGAPEKGAPEVDLMYWAQVEKDLKG